MGVGQQSKNGVASKKRSRSDRRRRHRRGLWAERVAAAYLMLKGYRILARRWKTHLGEVDLIAVRGTRVAFVEVKFRQTLALSEAAITASLRRRVRCSANLWLAKNTRFQAHDVGFDLIFLRPWHRPHHIENGL